MMKKITVACMLVLCLLLSACAMSAGSNINAKTAHFTYEFADAQQGTKRLMANTEYHDHLTKADLEYRMQKKGATKAEYLAFAEANVLAFTEEEKTAISECMQQIEDIIVERGYKLPAIDTITFVKTTMKEEGDAGAYTHNSDIYLGEAFLESYLSAPAEEKVYYTATMLHELFHCITRNNADFRRDMYEILGFTVAEQDFDIAPQIKERMISNPDVGHHDSYATFTIDGEKKDCFIIFLTTKDFENKGDSFFDNASAHLIPVDSPSTVYSMDDTADFWEVFGTNTSYVIDPEETLADNFSYAFLGNEAGFNDIDWPNPEILEAIVALLQA